MDSPGDDLQAWAAGVGYLPSLSLFTEELPVSR